MVGELAIHLHVSTDLEGKKNKGVWREKSLYMQQPHHQLRVAEAYPLVLSHLLLRKSVLAFILLPHGVRIERRNIVKKATLKYFLLSLFYVIDSV